MDLDCFYNIVQDESMLVQNGKKLAELLWKPILADSNCGHRPTKPNLLVLPIKPQEGFLLTKIEFVR